METTLENGRKYNKALRSVPLEHLKPFFEVMWVMTSECNFRCSYCYEEKVPGRITFDMAKPFLDSLFSIEDHQDYWKGYIAEPNKKTFRFEFFGGECTLEIDTIEKICQYFVDKCKEDLPRYQERIDNFVVSLQTNGYLLDTPKVLNFIEKWEKHMPILYITIDGSREQHDSCRLLKTGGPTWEKVKKNIALIREKFPNLPIGTKGTFTTTTAKYIYSSYLNYLDMGFKTINNSIAIGVPWTKEGLDTLREQYELVYTDLLKNHLDDGVSFGQFDYWPSDYGTAYSRFKWAMLGTCGLFGTRCSVTPRNEICMCQNFSYITQHKPSYIIGHMDTGIDLEKANEMTELVKGFASKNYYSDEKCKRCDTKAICETCPAFALQQTGDIEQSIIYECEARHIEKAASLKYQYLRDKLLWENGKRTCIQSR